MWKTFFAQRDSGREGGGGRWRGANPHYPFSLRPWLHMANHLSFSVRLITNHSNSILVLFIGWLFQALQILANQWLPNYLINMISSNIFSLCSFFSQHQPLDTHWSRSHYFGQISSSKLKFFKIVSLWSKRQKKWTWTKNSPKKLWELLFKTVQCCIS